MRGIGQPSARSRWILGLLTAATALCTTASEPTYAAASGASAEPIVRTTTGRYQATAESDGTLAFKGIRYKARGVEPHQLRWQRHVASWRLVEDDPTNRAVAVQVLLVPR